MPKTRGMDSERHRARSTITMITTMTGIINVIIIVITTITTTNTVIIHVAILIITQIRDGFRPSIRVTAPRKHYLLFQPYLHPVSAAFLPMQSANKCIRLHVYMYKCTLLARRAPFERGAQVQSRSSPNLKLCDSVATCTLSNVAPFGI